MEKNLTTGNLFKTIVYFALPYLLSYFLQTLYGMADLFITGQFCHVDAITAVSNGSQVMHMLTVIIVGLAMGATVTISRAIGADKKKDAARAIGNTVTLFMFVSIIFTAILLLFVRQIVALIGIPSEAVAGTTQYLVICFIGIPFITAYNIISSIFRGMGDSRTPMYFVAIACAANIVLDYVFIGFFHMGPSGAAFGTTLAQTLSVIIALVSICKEGMGIHLITADFCPDHRVMTQILKIGIPVAVQDGCIQVAFIVITIIANHRGLNDAAAVGIVEKVISAVFLVPSSMLAAVSALAAQNIGAGKHDRAAKTLRYSIMITTIYGIIISVIVQLIAPGIVQAFTAEAAVVVLGTQYIRSYIWDCIFAGIHFSFTGYFCAYGKSYIGFIHNIIAIILVRIPGSYLASRFFPDTLFPMGMAAPAGSLLSVLICLLAYGWLKSHSGLFKAQPETGVNDGR